MYEFTMKSMIAYLQRRSPTATFLSNILAAVILFSLSACPKQPRVRQERPVYEKYYEHTVKYAGETYGTIARWYTGNVQNWYLIADENPEIDPRKIRIGSVIRVPRELMIRERPYQPGGDTTSGNNKRSAKQAAEDVAAEAAAAEAEMKAVAENSRTQRENNQREETRTDEASPEVAPTAIPTPAETPVVETPTPAPTPASQAESNSKRDREQLLKELMTEY